MAGVSLVKLEQWLNELDDATTDPELRLKGTSFEKSFNESLGLPKLPGGTVDPMDFTVFAPWGSWAQEGQRGYPTPLQEAMLDVLAHGASDTTTPLIDLAALKPDLKFFTESGTDKNGKAIPCVAQAITDFIDSCDPVKTTPVLRFLVGDDHPNTRDQAWNREDVFTDLFWPKEGGQRVHRVKHPKARIYVGYYNPNFHPSPYDSGAAGLIRSMIENAATLSPSLAATVKSINPDKIINYLVKDGLRSISWNHGKVMAVNGKVVMTGGCNYWNAYAVEDLDGQKKLDHNIVDHQAKVAGDAAVSAHKWADYFWKYLHKVSEPGNLLATDDNSTWWGANLSDPGVHWFSGYEKTTSDPTVTFNPSVEGDLGNIPDDVCEAPFKPLMKDKPGTIPVLTVAKLGDWYGPMQEIDYPVMVIDAARDVILNAVWQRSIGAGDGYFGLGTIIYGLTKTLGDDFQKRLPYFQQYKINPAAWASRHTRTWAIANAQSSVIICQQMLVGSLQAGEDAFQGIIAGVNKGLKDEELWDGFIWPFDLLIAIAQAIGTMSKSDSNEEWKGVFIVQTTKIAKDRSGWEDQTSIERVKHRIRRIMNGLPSTAGGLPWDDIDGAIEKHLHFKRVMKDDGAMFSHSKIVCVDRKLMYVGSDNAYPCYNEEHGIWVENEATVGAWLKGFFDPYWKIKCEALTGEKEHFDQLKLSDPKRHPKFDN